MGMRYDKKVVIWGLLVIISTAVILSILAVFYSQAVHKKENAIRQENFRIISCTIDEIGPSDTLEEGEDLEEGEENEEQSINNAEDEEVEQEVQEVSLELIVETMDDLIKAYKADKIELFLLKKKNDDRNKYETVGINVLKVVEGEERNTENKKENVEIRRYKILTQKKNIDEYQFIRMEY